MTNFAGKFSDPTRSAASRQTTTDCFLADQARKSSSAFNACERLHGSPNAFASTRPVRHSVGLVLKLFLTLSLSAWVQPLLAETAEGQYRVGAYAGKFYDSSPEDLLTGRRSTSFKDQYIGALTLSKTLWRSERYPLAMEIEGVAAYQFGKVKLGELGVVPVLRWSGFPWNDYLPTSFRFGPIGLSWTSSVSPLERSSKGGSRWLNLLVADVGFSIPGNRQDEIFLRFHHRCAVYNLLNDYRANGEDFLAIGFRRNF